MDWFRDVWEFHRKFCPHLIEATPLAPDDRTGTLRIDLIDEERDELVAAMYDGDLPGIADAAVDLIYVTLGTLVSCGIDPRPIWEAVHAANLRKVGGAVRADGKCLKPVGWEHPDIAGILARQPPIE